MFDTLTYPTRATWPATAGMPAARATTGRFLTTRVDGVRAIDCRKS